MGATSRFVQARTPSTPESKEFEAVVQAYGESEAMKQLRSAMWALVSKGF